MKTKFSCLIVDDEKAVCDTLKYNFVELGIRTFTAESGEQALDILNNHKIDVVLTDFNMPEMNGLKLLEQIKSGDPFLPVIIITGYATIDLAVKTIRQGAYDFITKPVNIEKLYVIMNNAYEQVNLKKQNRILKYNLNKQLSYNSELIGESESIKNILKIIEQVSQTDSNVLITGESGVGKEIVAKQIFLKSKTFNNNFFTLNCTAIPENLVESELFGYKKGAFTGADKDKPGIVDQVDNGTLFLDEIGDFPVQSQGKLLRLIENNEYYKLGSSEKLYSEFRLITATNMDLKNQIENKKFRKDLFYRISVVNIIIPPLRKRKQDIVPLTKYFLKEFCSKLKKSVPELSDKVINKLMEYNFPGNVRELRNIIERMLIFDNNGIIKDIELIPEKTGLKKISEFQNLSLNELEKQYILQTLENNDHNKTKTAEILGISRKTLWSKLKKYN